MLKMMITSLSVILVKSFRDGVGGSGDLPDDLQYFKPGALI